MQKCCRWCVCVCVACCCFRWLPLPFWQMSLWRNVARRASELYRMQSLLVYVAILSDQLKISTTTFSIGPPHTYERTYRTWSECWMCDTFPYFCEIVYVLRCDSELTWLHRLQSAWNEDGHDAHDNKNRPKCVLLMNFVCCWRYHASARVLLHEMLFFRPHHIRSEMGGNPLGSNFSSPSQQGFHSQ